MGQWERNVKEVKLIEFQQWIWKKIPAEEEEWYSTNPKSVAQRRRRNKKKKEYNDYLEELRKMRQR